MDRDAKWRAKRNREMKRRYHVEKDTGPMLAHDYGLCLSHVYRIVGKRKKKRR